MGCTTSNSAAALALEEKAKSKILSLQIGELDQNDTLDVRTLTMLMWKARDSPELLEVLSDLVATQSDEREVFEGVEFYLPQLAHMVIHLEASLTSSTLEAFALLVSQLSLHFALQLYWILVASMEDYQPELSDGHRNPTAHPELYIRCATLLHKVEQSVVFGSPRCPEFETLFAQGKLTRDELHEIELADRRFMAAQIAESEHHDESFSGWLYYKRWNKTGMFQRKKWKQRYFKVLYRVLLCYSSVDGELRRAIPLQHTTVTVKEHRTHKYYFELAETKRERVYKLYASNEEEMMRWVEVLRQEAAAPPSYAPTDFDTTTLTPAQVGRYGFFRSEREFVRALTDICEELRFVDIPERKKGLEERLSQLAIPGCVYLPLTKSTDVWHRVVSVREKDGHPFSTRARCPCLLTFEVATEGPSGIDVANYLYQTLGLGAGLEGGLVEEESDLLLEDGPVDEGEVQEFNEEVGDLVLQTWREKFINSARQSVSAFNLSSITAAISPTHAKQEEEVPSEAGAVVGAKGRGIERNFRASTRKLVESARGAADRAKKEAGKAVGKVRTAVGNRAEKDEGKLFSIWTKRMPRGSASYGTEQEASASPVNGNTTPSSLQDRKHERQTLNKKRAIQLIKSRSANVESDLEATDGGNQDYASTTGDGEPVLPKEDEVSTNGKQTEKGTTSERHLPVRREGSSLGERPFLRSLGRIATKPLKVGKLAARLKEGGRHTRTSSTDAAEDAAAEPSTELRQRIRSESNLAMSLGGWDISRVITKSNDDLRQEVFVMQLIQFMNDIWIDAGVRVHVHPYRILSTSKDCGIIEVVDNATSLDGFKKKHGKSTRLLKHLENTFGVGTPQLEEARRNFTVSMAGYSIICYLLSIKDRHNGNIMFDKDGFITHIDFGFVFGMAPGKNKVPHTNFSMERAAFKFTSEMAEVMGGKGTLLWKEFEQLFVDGLKVCRNHSETLLTLVEIMGYKSNYPCFNQPGGTAQVLKLLKRKLMIGTSDEKLEKKVRNLISNSLDHKGTLLYERFQEYSNGIFPIY